MLLPEDHFLEVGPLQSSAEAWLLQQLKHAQAVRKDNIVAIPFTGPISKIVNVLDKGRIIQVAILRQVCKRTNVWPGKCKGAWGAREPQVGAQCKYSGLASDCTNSSSACDRCIHVPW